MSHLRIFLVLLGIVARLASAVDLLALCRGKLSGTLLPNPHDCGSYYVCQSGPQLAHCGEGLHFDRVHKVCNWPETANCRLSEFEQEQPRHSAETLKEDSTRDESNEVKPSNQESDESNEKIGEASEPNSVLSQNESNEKIVKDESTELVVKPSYPVSESSQDESNEEIVELKPNSIEVELQEAAKEDSTQDEELVEELVEQLVDTSKPEEEQTVIEKEESEKTPSFAIEVPIVVPGDRPNFLTSNSSASSPDHPNPIIAVQVPVSVLRPNPVQFTVENEELLKPSKEPDHLNLSGLGTSLLEDESAAPESVRPTIELHMPVKGGKNPEHAEQNLDSLKPSHSASHVFAVNVPVHKFEITSPTVNGSSSNDDADVGSSKPAHNATHVVQVHVPVHHSEAASSIVGGDAEAVASPTPSHNAAHVIEVHVPVHPMEVGDFIANAHNSTAQAEQIAEKVEASEGEQQEPEVPVEATNSIELPDTIVEKVGSANELKPAYISNAIPNIDSIQPSASSGPVHDISNAFVSAVVERVDSGRPTTGSGQVIELPGPALPAEVSNAIMNAVDAVQPADAVVEKVGYVKATTGSGQVIELPAQASPAFVSNAIVNAVDAFPPAEAVVERVQSAKPAESSAIVNTGNGIPQGEVLVEKVSVNPSNQFVDLSGPQFPAVVPTNLAEGPALEFHASAAEEYDSESLESSGQSSKESSNSESSGEVAANVDSSEDDPTLQSSEKVHQEVNGADDNVDSTSLEDHQTVPEAGQSAEENIVEVAEDNFGSQSAESHEPDGSAQQNLEKVDSQSSEEELPFAAAHESSAEELDQENEANIEESPLSVDVGEDKQTTDRVSSFEHISSKPNNRPTEQRPISDVVKDKRPTKRPSTHKPKPGGDRNVTGQSHAPAPSQTDFNSGNHPWNLTEVILSVGANTSSDGTITRPIVGAHDINTGDPIDVMVDYNSKYVQCIHNGLYFLPHPSNCQKYFICAYRHLHLHSCGDSLIWSYKRERCELEIDSRCFSNETLKPEKSTRPARENKYNATTAATNAVRTSTPMPPLRTTYPSTLAETPRILDEELPKCPSLRQAYLPSYDDCNKYFICILGHAVLTSCPDKLHWDAIGEFCGRSSKARCASRVPKVSA